MMTTGYDCQDLLNIALMRPVFSPSDFVQIKGRGTRKYLFNYTDSETNENYRAEKETFKFFDFFATCEYFERDFKYDDKIKLPVIKKISVLDTSDKKQGEFVDENGEKIFKGPIDLQSDDKIVSVSHTEVGSDGMRIDREGFRRAVEEDVLANSTLSNLWNNGDIIEAEEYTKKHIFDKPSHFLNLEKIRKIFNVDRRISVREFLQIAFGEKDSFESKNELLDTQWEKFIELNPIDQEHYYQAKDFFKSYISDSEVRDIIDRKAYAELFNSPALSFETWNSCNGFKEIIPRYIKDYVSLNTFMN